MLTVDPNGVNSRRSGNLDQFRRKDRDPDVKRRFSFPELALHQVRSDEFHGLYPLSVQLATCWNAVLLAAREFQKNLGTLPIAQGSRDILTCPDNQVRRTIDLVNR